MWTSAIAEWPRRHLTLLGQVSPAIAIGPLPHNVDTSDTCDSSQPGIPWLCLPLPSWVQSAWPYLLPVARNPTWWYLCYLVKGDHVIAQHYPPKCTLGHALQLRPRNDSPTIPYSRASQLPILPSYPNNSFIFLIFFVQFLFFAIVHIISEL